MSSSGSHAGRPKSWVAVSVIFVGFTLGGVALCIGPNWPLVIAGAVIIAVGGLLALVVDIMSDVVLAAERRN
ncbi:HGxxPAAW family protein [Actinomadura adrarensis]|uniref:HGxxPAAW family protein n=1 Tax=Actinomadura adrarensis TaxID=1819600 RepID=A0ABW3CLG2_9ACTN